MVAPPWFEIPPRAYGGIEWIVYWLVEGLMQRGHDVVLIAAGKDHTTARFVQTLPVPPSERVGESLPEMLQAAAVSRSLVDADLDVVHDHSLAGPLAARSRRVPTIVTAHGPVTGEFGEYYRLLGDTVSLVAVSNAQRRSAPDLPWVATIYNSISTQQYPMRVHKEDFALFVGRMSEEKGVHLAMDAAREAHIPLVLAAKCTEPSERNYFAREIEPRLGYEVEWIGEIDTDTKKELMSRACCLLFPIQWEEPFGIVMIEAMACGTPVVSLDRGSVSEVVKDGITGFVCSSPRQLAAAIQRCGSIDPTACRAWVVSRFDTSTMVSKYENVYRKAIARAQSPDLRIGHGASREVIRWQSD